MVNVTVKECVLEGSIPMDAAFIGDAMSRLPDHKRMKIVAANLHRGPGDRTLADDARDSFNAALFETLDIADPPIEGDWWLPPRAAALRVS